MSASDSTFTRYIAEGKEYRQPSLMQGGAGFRSTSLVPRFGDADATSNLFDSKCSTLYAGLKQSCTSAAPSSTSPTTVDLRVAKQLSGIVDSDAHIGDAGAREDDAGVEEEDLRIPAEVTAILDARPVAGEVLPNLIKHLLIVEF
jgi:hypothetical protein